MGSGLRSLKDIRGECPGALALMQALYEVVIHSGALCVHVRVTAQLRGLAWGGSWRREPSSGTSMQEHIVLVEAEERKENMGTLY